MNFKMNKIAEAAIKECRGHGIVLTDENIIILYELGKLADETINTGFRYYRGKQLGNIRIYPLTLGSRLWLNYEARELCQFDDNLFGWCMVWAFAHANDSDAFEFNSYKELKNTIKKWGKKIDCTDDELTAALVEIGEMSNFELTSSRKKDEDEELKLANEEKSAISALMNFFMTEFGNDLSYWLWDVSEAQANKLMQEFMSKETHKVVVSSDDLPVKAYVKMRQYIEGLKEAMPKTLPKALPKEES